WTSISISCPGAESRTGGNLSEFIRFRPEGSGLNAASNALYAAPIGNHPAYLLWVREGRLMSRAFDPGRGELTGDVLPVASPVGLGQASAFAEFAVSNDGTLVYTGGPALSQLTWV